ncbi:MAG: N-acetylglucosamine-6-phosphate deacetylase [Halioglobus sp.]
MNQVIVNGTIFTGDALLHDHCVLISQGRIVDVIERHQAPADFGAQFDLQGGTLIPGFIDLQVNGGGGILFNQAPSVETLRAIGAVHRQYGTTGFLATLITDDFAVMKRALNAVKQAIDQRVPGILGIHLEGPFLDPQHKGIHDARKFCQLDQEGLALVTSLGTGKTIVTLAPERTNSSMIRALKDSGVIVCAGHSSADYEQTVMALAAGVSGFTHLYNAMTPLLSREPGMVGAALDDDDSWFGIIADGYHIHPAAFRVAVTAKKAGCAVLVTDAMPTVGSSCESFELGDELITQRDGRLMNASGKLAGSNLDMLTAVNNATRFARIDWFEAVRMATLYPARALELDGELGAVRQGYRANLVALDTHNCIRASWIEGEQSH